MDLLDFADCKLYFEDPLPKTAEDLIETASNHYGSPEGEHALLFAHFVAPEHLAVLVALYRYYFYQRRLPEALVAAERSLQLAARRLYLPGDWRDVDEESLAGAATLSFGLLRFHLLALKASSVVLLRLGHIDEARQRLAKLKTLDRLDQLGVARLLEVVDEFRPTAGHALAA